MPGKLDHCRQKVRNGLHSGVEGLQAIIARLEQIILHPPHFALRVAIALAAVAGATLLRWFVDRGEAGFTFSAYLALIAIFTTLFGWATGLLTATVSLLVVRFAFLPGAWFEDATPGRIFVFGCSAAWLKPRFHRRQR